MLANLRYRLEPRLKAAGIELSWGVEQLPLMTWLDALAMRHVQFMVYEAISNALQHAGATVMRIELKLTQEGGAQFLVRLVTREAASAPLRLSVFVPRPSSVTMMSPSFTREAVLLLSGSVVVALSTITAVGAAFGSVAGAYTHSCG